jgi:hypothetical protein
MEYVIAVAACAWMVPFLVLEHRVPGRTGYVFRIVGSVPVVLLAILVLLDRFSPDALTVTVFFVVIVNVVGLVVAEGRKRRSRQRPG